MKKTEQGPTTVSIDGTYTPTKSGLKKLAADPAVRRDAMSDREALAIADQHDIQTRLK
jgi:hypothetical protein